MQQKINAKVYRIDPSIPPCASVSPGETFTVELQNAFGKSFESIAEFEAFMAPENQDEKLRLNHPCTGPIEIKTDRKDISLAVHIVECKASRGYQCISRSTGLLKETYLNRDCDIYFVGQHSTVKFHGGDLCLHGTPKVGFMATVGHEVQSCGRAAKNGGNLDFNFLDQGSTIYLPVHRENPQLLIGDLHLCQGNGEAAGIAVEADGEVTLRVSIVDKIDFPVIDRKDVLVVVGWGNTLEESLKQSVENAIAYLQRIFPFCDWSQGEIYKFISAEGNLIMGNSTGHVKTCGTVFIKKRITNKFSFSVF